MSGHRKRFHGTMFPFQKKIEGSCITPDATHQRYVGSIFKKYEKNVKSVTRTRLAPFDLTKKKKKTFVVQDAIEDSTKSHGRHTSCCLIVQEEGYIAEHPNDEEEVEGIDLHQQCYLWEGSDMDYLYDEEPFVNKCLGCIRLLSLLLLTVKSLSLQCVRTAKASQLMAQAGNICVAAFDSTCSGICRSDDPIVEVNMQCVDLKIIIWKLHFEAFPQHINRP
ncbi:hypothetical protein YC2023_037046 [Brassica napus]